MAKNAYAKRLDAARAAREYAMRRYTRQQMLDFVTIALGRMGYGEKRLKDFEQMLSAVYIEFAKAFTDDLKDDKECVYTKECLDRELQQYCGSSFEPFYSRHDFCESAVYIGVPGKWRVTWNHEMLDANSVTHWMPLPQPPKGE